MKITEKYVIAFKGPKAQYGKTIMEKSTNGNVLKGKQTLERAFKLADSLGVLNSNDKQKMIDKETKGIEDFYLSLGNGEGDLTEYLETENGFIIRTIEGRETMKEMQARGDREYAERNKEN